MNPPVHFWIHRQTISLWLRTQNNVCYRKNILLVCCLRRSFPLASTEFLMLNPTEALILHQSRHSGQYVEIPEQIDYAASESRGAGYEAG